MSILDKLIKAVKVPIDKVTIKYRDLESYHYLMAFVVSGDRLTPEDYAPIETFIRRDYRCFIEYGDMSLLKHLDNVTDDNLHWFKHTIATGTEELPYDWTSSKCVDLFLSYGNFFRNDSIKAEALILRDMHHELSLIEKHISPCEDYVELFTHVDQCTNLEPIFRIFPNGTLHVCNTVEFLLMCDAKVAKAYPRLIFEKECNPHLADKIISDTIRVAYLYDDDNGIKSIIESALVHSMDQGLKILDMCGSHTKQYVTFLRYVKTRNAKYLMDMRAFEYSKELYDTLLGHDDEYRWANSNAVTLSHDKPMLKLSVKCFYNYMFAHSYSSSADIRLYNFETNMFIGKEDMWVYDVDAFTLTEE